MLGDLLALLETLGWEGTALCGVSVGGLPLSVQFVGRYFDEATLFQVAAEIALAHHERWDGKGYPNQLAGQAIPLSGRIVTIVDFYDALTMDRVYRPAFSHEKALEMLLAERGKAFDPDIVDCFLRNSAAISALREQVTVGRMTFADLINRKQEAP